MINVRGCARLVAFSIAAVYFACAGGRISADPPQPVKTSPIGAKPSPIPQRILKDIQRVRPGMTRADLDWLFCPQDGIVAIGSNQSTYVYQYGEVGVPALDAHGQPILDANTHQPISVGDPIKIDVTFKLATRRVDGKVAESGTNPHLTDNNGRADDVIVKVSDPYLGWAIDN